MTETETSDVSLMVNSNIMVIHTVIMIKMIRKIKIKLINSKNDFLSEIILK